MPQSAVIVLMFQLGKKYGTGCINATYSSVSTNEAYKSQLPEMYLFLDAREKSGRVSEERRTWLKPRERRNSVRAQKPVDH